MRPTFAALCCAPLSLILARPVPAAIPRYDHVVIVVMENHGEAQIVGNVAAPYITSLSAQGANFTNSHGVAHPSQPNYLALFSGSTQGVGGDSCPHTFTGVDNLAAQLASAGLSFAGYSESMPGAGFTGCHAGDYARKHNPWVNFTNVPASANQPYSAFPGDYGALPTVAFVVPNLANDMHDGSVSAGDTWLKTNIDAYAQWAKAHNSLLVLTFDEDDYSTANNLVPTILVGAGIVPGNYGEAINHYSVLATIEGMYGLTALTSAAPVAGVFGAGADASAPRPEPVIESPVPAQR
jgi:acid phosphatase